VVKIGVWIQSTREGKKGVANRVESQRVVSPRDEDEVERNQISLLARRGGEQGQAEKRCGSCIAGLRQSRVTTGNVRTGYMYAG
jgi:hypothetical protein